MRLMVGFLVLNCPRVDMLNAGSASAGGSRKEREAGDDGGGCFPS